MLPKELSWAFVTCLLQFGGWRRCLALTLLASTTVLLLYTSRGFAPRRMPVLFRQEDLLPPWRPGDRPRHHAVWMLCGNESSDLEGHFVGGYIDQNTRLIKSFILSQTTHYGAGRFDWILWVFTDSVAGPYAISAAEELQPLGLGAERGRASVHVRFIDIGPLEDIYGDRLHIMKKCASAQLYAPLHLPQDVDEFLLLGADEIAVGDLDGAWDSAVRMGWDDSKLAALAEECVEPRGLCGWYNRWNRMHRFWFNGVNGLHTGGTIFSLRNMRRYGFLDWINKQVDRFGLEQLALADQDLMNRYMQAFPDRLTVQQCIVDVRVDAGCNIEAEKPLLLHGNRQWFVRNETWARFAEEVDRIFDAWRWSGREPPGDSLWDGAPDNVRQAVIASMSRPWGLSEKFSGPPFWTAAPDPDDNYTGPEAIPE